MAAKPDTLNSIKEKIWKVQFTWVRESEEFFQSILWMGSWRERYVCKNDYGEIYQKLVEGYRKYTRSDAKVQKTCDSPCLTVSNNDLEVPYNVDKYRSYVVQLMWYTSKVVPDVENTARELTVHIKVFGRLIGYLKVLEIKVIVIRNHKVLKDVMFWCSNYAKDNYTT